MCAIGDTVLRPAHGWTPAVHSLLRYLEAVGFQGVPRVLGFDEQGREVLSFIPGAVALRPWPDVMLEDTGLAEVARFLSRYHDVVRDFEPPEDVEWCVPGVQWRPGMTIRHEDLGPWNTVWEGRTFRGVIDWDFAEPGDPLWDVGQFAWYAVPLRGEDHWREAGFSAKPDLRARLNVVSGTYGTTPGEILDAVFDLQSEEYRRIETLGKSGLFPWSLFYERGDLAQLTEETTWLRANYDSLVLWRTPVRIPTRPLVLQPWRISTRPTGLRKDRISWKSRLAPLSLCVARG